MWLLRPLKWLFDNKFQNILTCYDFLAKRAHFGCSSSLEKKHELRSIKQYCLYQRVEPKYCIGAIHGDGHSKDQNGTLSRIRMLTIRSNRIQSMLICSHILAGWNIKMLRPALFSWIWAVNLKSNTKTDDQAKERNKHKVVGGKMKFSVSAVLSNNMNT